MFFGAPAVELVLEQRKYYFWLTIDSRTTYFSELSRGRAKDGHETYLDIKKRGDLYRNVKISSIIPLLLAHR